MAIPVVFGSYQFRTKTAAKECIRKRISNYDFGDKLNDNDELFFSELFTLHDEHREKVGSGISFISVERDFHNNKSLYINRTDGSKIDISWVHCVQPASVKTVVSVAFRRAVKETITQFKSNCINENLRCPKLGFTLDYSDSHVVYVQPTFDQLLFEFLQLVGRNIESIELVNPRPDDRDQRGIIKSLSLTSAWVDYHLKHAHLELWSSEANLKRQTSK
ncbi:DUF3223 domain-containing protein [Vibrio splendidus]|uniref:DUF3223 domain-containing protein n=1 Tax=Vibrio splendidus TaxID=29497 RepID=UPI00076AE22F|nr:DUF3223 domain-containing protein [Vibrio splendidus]PHX07627.1 hypothetical protein VSPL_05650 [Vibrio splendidus]